MGSTRRRSSLLVVATSVAALAPPFARGARAEGPVPRFSVFEATLQAARAYANPYAEASGTATFNGPGAQRRTVPLFWDGGSTWRVRFSPDAPGTWTWSVASGDPGLAAGSGTFEVTASGGRGGLVHRASHPLHLERQDGSPVFLLGETNWAAFGRIPEEGLDRASVLAYFDARAGQGFNYLHASLMSPGVNEGGPVFGSVAAETLNPAYFREVDLRVRHMNARGITAGIVLAWGGGTPSWTSFVSDAARRRYARYVAARYSAHDVVFVVSGEWDEAGLPRSVFDAIGGEIRASDPHGRLVTIHATGSVEEFADEPWMSLGDYQQLYTSLHANILGARDHGKPVLNAEYAYYLRDQDGDGRVDKPNSATLAEIRHASWDIVMAGGYFVTGWGTTYLGGGRDPGPFNPDDPRNDDWEEDVQHVSTLFRSVEWWRLEPNDSLLAGSGTRYCLAEIGRQYVAYVRGASAPLALSLGAAPAASYQVRRFDPRAGTFASLPAHEGSGPLTLVPPDAQDWLFVVTNGAPRVPGHPDLDGDGWADLLWHHQATGELYAWLMRAGAARGGVPLTPRHVDPAWQVRGLSDLDASGGADVLWRHQATGELYAWLLDGTAASGGSPLEPARLADAGWRIRGLADLNTDGRPDILWHNRHTGDLYAWFMSGVRAVGGAYLSPGRVADTRWQIRGLADLNSDGTPDVLWHHDETGQVYAWLMEGVRAAGGSPVGPGRLGDTRWRIRRLQDVDGDGQPDLLWQHAASGDLYVWYLSGTTAASGGYLSPGRVADPRWQLVPQ